MPRRLTTTQRGLGHDHQSERQRQLRELVPGTPCWRCAQPMWPYQELDLDHVTDRYFGGAGGLAVLAHASCNRSAGGKLGSQIAGAGLPRRTHSAPAPCATCGKVTDRSAKFCEVCGAHCHPSHSFVLTCGRVCGAKLQQRNRMAKGWIPPAQRPKPPKLPPRPRPVASGQREPKNGWPSSELRYYTCRYCGQLSTAPGTGQRREVCPGRICQLARLKANNLRARDGLSKEQADTEMAVLVKAVLDARLPGNTPLAWSELAWTHALEGNSAPSPSRTW